ncbi:hypothetical protein ScPMuIL_016099 [Solemya velum]
MAFQKSNVMLFFYNSQYSNTRPTTQPTTTVMLTTTLTYSLDELVLEVTKIDLIPAQVFEVLIVAVNETGQGFSKTIPQPPDDEVITVEFRRDSFLRQSQ